MRAKKCITAFATIYGRCIIMGFAALFSVTGAGVLPALAQVSVSAEELLEQLAPGDILRIVRTDGSSMEGILKRTHVEKQWIEIGPKAEGQPEAVLSIDEARTIERLPDSVKNGTLIGLGVGAGVAITLFVRAMAIDYNEIDEWAGIYVAYGAAFAGIGSLIGCGIDAAMSKPRIRYEAVGIPTPPMTWSIRPLVTPDRKGLALTVRF